MISKKISYLAVALILGISFILMLDSSLGDSAVMDELAHIPAAYSYLKLGDNRLNPEHPPLLKDLAGIPLLFTTLNFPSDSSYWQTNINGQWDVGRVFLYESGNNADKIINLARLSPIFLTLLTGFLLYVISKKRLGAAWALLPLLLFSLSPLVLAHGHYVTTDVAASFGALLSLWLFINYLKNPAKKNLILAGLGFGVSQLSKFSLVILVPVFILLGIIFCLVKLYQNWPEISSGHKIREAIKRFLKIIGVIILIFIIGYILVYLVYLPQNINYPKQKQALDTAYLLGSFAGGPDPHWLTCKTWTGSLLRQARCLANIDIWMATKPALKPLAQYFLGLLMVFQRSTAGNTGYFLGQVSASGWSDYFPIVFLIKEPLPSLILIFLALILGCWRLIKSLLKKSVVSRFFGWVWQHFSEFSMLIFVAVYWFISIRSPLNIGFRHLLPIFPFMYLLTAYEIKKWWIGEKKYFFLNWRDNLKAHLKSFGKIVLKASFVALLIIWYLTEVIFIAPYFISYFNELVGGSKNGYKYVVDSNLDWGQDLKRLASFVEKNNIQKIKLDYFGGGSPLYYLGEKFEPWQSAKGQPEVGSWFAVSLTFLENSQGQPVPGFERKFEDAYWWLKDKQPFSRIGYSIFIYKF